jgi:quaternary ammonium compound-resistance protein SugE
MAWLYLAFAGLLEVAWTVAAMFSEGFSKPVPSVVALIAYLGSAVMLGIASREVPIGTAYAVWVGFGAVGAAIAGAALHGEPMTPQRVGWLVLLLVAITGLKSSGTTPEAPDQALAGPAPAVDDDGQVDAQDVDPA